MGTHHITKEGIDEWLKTSTREYAAHHGGGYNKSLQVTLAGEWLVIDHKKEIYRGNIDMAIDTYNAIVPKLN